MSDRIEQLRKFHEQDPTDTFCTYGLAMEHAKAGEIEEALTWLEKTLEIDADYAYAHFQKAKLLGEAGRTDEARTAADQGLEAARRSGDEKAAGELEELRASLG